MATAGDSVRQYLIDHLIERLRTIRRANDYHSDIGAHVYDEDIAPGQAETPFVLVLEDVEQPDREVMVGQYDRVLSVTLGFCEAWDQPRPKYRSRLLLADVQKLMGTVSSFTGPIGGGSTTSLTLRVVETANLLNGGGMLEGKVYGQADYQLSYVTSLRDPHVGKQQGSLI